MAVVGAIAAVVGVVAGTSLSLVAAGQAKKAARAEGRFRALQERRAKIKTIRDARIRRAAALNRAQTVGAGGSSSVATGASGALAQAANTLTFLDDAGALQAERNKFLQKSQFFGAIASVVQKAGKAAPGIAQSTLFT